MFFCKNKCVEKFQLILNFGVTSNYTRPDNNGVQLKGAPLRLFPFEFYLFYFNCYNKAQLNAYSKCFCAFMTVSQKDGECKKVKCTLNLMVSTRSSKVFFITTNNQSVIKPHFYNFCQKPFNIFFTSTLSRLSRPNTTSRNPITMHTLPQTSSHTSTHILHSLKFILSHTPTHKYHFIFPLHSHHLDYTLPYIPSHTRHLIHTLSSTQPHIHHLIHTTSYTPPHTHHLIHTTSYTPPHTHHLIHTTSYTPPHTHHLIHTTSYTPPHTHHLIHITSYTPPHTYHLMHTTISQNLFLRYSQEPYS